MKKSITAALLFGALAAGPAFAQSAPSTSPSTPAVSTTNGNNTTAAPVPGANSFTMAQAQKRIEERGFTQVSGLKKDDQSIWRGQAVKDGKQVNVALDYQGNVTAN